MLLYKSSVKSVLLYGSECCVWSAQTWGDLRSCTTNTWTARSFRPTKYHNNTITTKQEKQQSKHHQRHYIKTLKMAWTCGKDGEKPHPKTCFKMDTTSKKKTWKIQRHLAQRLWTASAQFLCEWSLSMSVHFMFQKKVYHDLDNSVIILTWSWRHSKTPYNANNCHLLVDITSIWRHLDSLKLLIQSNPVSSFSPLFVNGLQIPQKEQTICIINNPSKCLPKTKFNFIEFKVDLVLPASGSVIEAG